MLIKRRVKKSHKQTSKATLGVTKEIPVTKQLEGDYLNLDIFRIEGKSGSIHELEHRLVKKVVKHAESEYIQYEAKIRAEAHIKLMYRCEDKKEEIRIVIPFKDNIKLTNYQEGTTLDIKGFITNIRYREMAGPPITLQAKAVLAIMQK